MGDIVLKLERRYHHKTKLLFTFEEGLNTDWCWKWGGSEILKLLTVIRITVYIRLYPD